MTAIVGNLRDFAADLIDAQPQIIFTASQPATTGTYLLATKPVVVTPDIDGNFEAQLQATTSLTPWDTYYTVSVRWLEADGGYQAQDFPAWRIYVPDVTSNPAGPYWLSGLIDQPVNPAWVWVSDTEPPNPVLGSWWMRPSTGDLYEWTS